MKKKFIVALFLIASLAACDQNKEEVENETKKSDSLQGIVDEKEGVINSFLTMFTDIQKNLDSISKREKNIYLRTENTELLRSVVIKEINEDIKVINDILEWNKKTIRDINRKLKQAINKNEKLEAAMNTLNQQLIGKEADLESLKNTLAEYDKKIISLQTTVGILTDKNESLEDSLAVEKDRLQTAYYVIGERKELEKDSIIDRKGGLIGIGKTAVLKDDFNTRKFTKINYTQINTIPVNHKKVKLATTHPTGSYKLETENELVLRIRILDPEKFWSASKYLVVIKI